jgi:hypothetical protein
MSGPVPQDDDLLVLRFKRHPAGPDKTLLEIWAGRGMTKEEFRAVLQNALDQLDTDDFQRIG